MSKNVAPSGDAKKKRKSLERARNLIMDIFGAFQSGSATEALSDVVYDEFAKVINPLEKMEKEQDEKLMRENLSTITTDGLGKQLIEKFDSNELIITSWDGNHHLKYNRRELNIVVFNTMRNHIIKIALTGKVSERTVSDMLEEYDRGYLEYLRRNDEKYGKFYWNHVFKPDSTLLETLGQDPTKLSALLASYKYYNMENFGKVALDRFATDFNDSLVNLGKGYIAKAITTNLEACDISFRSFQKCITISVQNGFLLLGPGDSGKTVFFRQFRWFLQDRDWLEKTEVISLDTIYANIIMTIAAFSQYFQNGSCSFKDSKNLDKILNIRDISEQSNILIHAKTHFTPQLYQDCSDIIQDAGFQDAYEKWCFSAHVFDGFEYFRRDWQRLAPPKYVPTYLDVLNSRRKTTGGVEIELGDKITIMDTGGQRSERKKWPMFVQTRKCVYLVPLGDFDKVCYEDDSTNRLIEAIELFDVTINKSYKGQDVILIFTKLDIFKKKIEGGVTLSHVFPDYYGGNSYDYALEHVISKFLRRDRSGVYRIQYYYCDLMDNVEITKILKSILSIEPYIQTIKRRFVCISRVHDIFFHFK